jgi:ComF family protein
MRTPAVPRALCPACRESPLAIDGIRSVLLLSGGAREAVHRLKYGGGSALAAPLARPMAEYWRATPLPADVFVAVPLHIARERERGYNQAHLLGRELGQLVGLTPLGGTLRRERNTPAQVGLDASARRANVAGAFSYQVPRRGEGVRGLRVLLVDDVCTTGATLEACSVALKAAGAASVWGFTLARAA